MKRLEGCIHQRKQRSITPVNFLLALHAPGLWWWHGSTCVHFCKSFFFFYFYSKSKIIIILISSLSLHISVLILNNLSKQRQYFYQLSRTKQVSMKKFSILPRVLSECQNCYLNVIKMLVLPLFSFWKGVWNF